MVSASETLYYILHPYEFKAIVQWKTWHQAPHQRDIEKESPELQRCFRLLEMTSRSFSAVIQELHPELLIPVSLFYLILRALDTIEDDMTIDLDVKVPILRDFDRILTKEGWKFSGCGPDEKDRQLLEEMSVVISQFMKVKPVYRSIIEDITHKMGNGMADYCTNAEFNENGVNSVADYDLYCHYVAGLVGEGLTRLFVEADLANPKLLERDNLHNSMGVFLQKTNIIRDVHEDFVDKRRFWPKEIWSKHVPTFDQLFTPENREAALNCNSEMILNALNHVEECMFYLAGLREQSIFNFAAIPQVMAIATLDLCFRNYDMFRRNVKITKGDACRLMLKTTSVQGASEIFLKYARSIHTKNTTKDPLFLDISIACAKIERWVHSIFPPETSGEIARKQEAAMLGPVEDDEPPDEMKEKARQDVKAIIDKMDARKLDKAAQKEELLMMLAAAIAMVFVVAVIMAGLAFGLMRYDLEGFLQPFMHKWGLAPAPTPRPSVDLPLQMGKSEL